MKAKRIIGIALISIGIMGLIYGNFSVTKDTHEAKIGPIEISVKDKENVHVPRWAGIGAIVAGGVLLLL